MQLSTSLSESERKSQKAANTQGDPIKLPSKSLAVAVNPYLESPGDIVFVAGSGGSLSALRLSTNELTTFAQGPTAPLTSLAFLKLPDAGITCVLSGSWDKSLWRFTFSGSKFVEHSSFPAHNDFVKSLLVAPTGAKSQVIISGGSDQNIRLWSPEGQSLGLVNPNARGIECLVLDPLSSPDAPVVFASTSQRDIVYFSIPKLGQIVSHGFELAPPILAHETSVYKLHFDADGDLWTASADKTAKRLSRAEGWKADTTLIHPDFVRDVMTHDKYGWVVTACRDENVRVWNMATGELHHVFTGHFEEVTALALAGDLVISVSIDQTLRRWSLAPKELQKAVDEAKNPRLLEQEPEPKTDLGMLTEEEEAELRALMESEESEVLEKMAMDEQ